MRFWEPGCCWQILGGINAMRTGHFKIKDDDIRMHLRADSRLPDHQQPWATTSELKLQHGSQLAQEGRVVHALGCAVHCQATVDQTLIWWLRCACIGKHSFPVRGSLRATWARPVPFWKRQFNRMSDLSRTWDSAIGDVALHYVERSHKNF